MWTGHEGRRQRPIEIGPRQWRWHASTGGSAENDSNSMRSPIIDEPEAEIVGEDNSVDLH
jgi:hypothetical protein